MICFKSGLLQKFSPSQHEWILFQFLELLPVWFWQTCNAELCMAPDSCLKGPFIDSCLCSYLARALPHPYQALWNSRNQISQVSAFPSFAPVTSPVHPCKVSVAFWIKFPSTVQHCLWACPLSFAAGGQWLPMVSSLLSWEHLSLDRQQPMPSL